VYEYLRTNQVQARDYLALTSAGVPIAPFTMFREMKFTLRGEFFNAWNHAQFANPNAGANAGTSFGRITSTQHAARIIQIGSTFNF